MCQNLSTCLCVLFLQSIWGTLMGSRQHVDVDIFNYDGMLDSTSFVKMTMISCGCLVNGLSWSSAPSGQTPLQAAVQSHNAVVKELRKQDSLPQKMELLQRKKLYLECIKILLLMGASAGTKVGSRPGRVRVLLQVGAGQPGS